MANEAIFGLIAKRGVPNSFVIDLDYPHNVQVGYQVLVETGGLPCNYIFMGVVTHITQPDNDKSKAIATVFFKDKIQCETVSANSFTISVSIIIPTLGPNPNPVPVPAPGVTNKVDLFDIP